MEGEEDWEVLEVREAQEVREGDDHQERQEQEGQGNGEGQKHNQRKPPRAGLVCLRNASCSVLTKGLTRCVQ